MKIARLFCIFIPLTLLSCGGYFYIDNKEKSRPDDDDATTDDLSIYEGATLTIISPEPGEIYIIDDGILFDAEIRNGEGEVLDFSDIYWTTTIDDEWSLSGDHIHTTDLIIGLQDFTASSELPNGAQLTYTVGGITIQSRYTGEYEGSLEIIATIIVNWSPYETTCTGDFSMEVDIYGERMSGNSICYGTIYNYEYDVDMALSGILTEGEISGDISFQFYGYSHTIPFSGYIDDNFYTVYGAFEEDGSTYSVDGVFEGERVSLDITRG